MREGEAQSMEANGTESEGADLADSAAQIARQSAPELDRLPPPAFPPGNRRIITPPRSQRREPTSADAAFPEDAFISPDEPIRRIGSDLPDDAFIPPDAPIRKRDPRTQQGSEMDDGTPPTNTRATEETDDTEWDTEDGEGEVVVTGIGAEGPVYYEASAGYETSPSGDLEGAASTLEALARELREKGGGALLVDPKSPPLQAGLRGLLAGFILGRRS